MLEEHVASTDVSAQQNKRCILRLIAVFFLTVSKKFYFSDPNRVASLPKPNQEVVKNKTRLRVEGT